MQDNTSRRDVLRQMGSIGAAIGGSQGIASAKQQEIMKKASEIDTELLNGRRARKKLNKVRRKFEYKKLEDYLAAQELRPNLKNARVRQVTEANGTKRDVVLIPFVDEQTSSRGRRRREKENSQSQSVSERFVLYNGLDDLSTSEFKDLNLDYPDDVSSQSNDDDSIPNAFSARIYEPTETGSVSTQNTGEGSIQETTVYVEDGQIVTTTNQISSPDDVFGGESQDVSAQSISNCSTCMRKVEECSSYNWMCVGEIASAYLVAIGSCYLCYQSGGTVQTVGGCTICLGTVGELVFDEDEMCDLGHDCHSEWKCIPESREASLCGCPDAKVSCSEVKKEV